LSLRYYYEGFEDFTAVTMKMSAPCEFIAKPHGATCHKMASFKILLSFTGHHESRSQISTSAFQDKVMEIERDL
jgi:hypothetical protein